MDEAPIISNPLLWPQVKCDSDRDARIAEIQRQIQAEKELRVKNEAEVVPSTEEARKAINATAKFDIKEELAPNNPPPPNDMASSDNSYQFPPCPTTTNAASQNVSSAAVSKARASAGAAREKVQKIQEVSVVGEKAVLDFKPPHTPKVLETQKFLEDVIKEHPILSLLEQRQIRDIVNAMEQRIYCVDEEVIKEGEEGENLFVSEYGNFQVSIDGRCAQTFGPGVVFGELALLYERPHTATVTAISGKSSPYVARTWAIDRQAFQILMTQTGLLQQRSYLKCIRDCEAFEHLHGDAKKMMQLVNDLTEERYNPGEYVCKEGAIGSTFYIVQEGQLDVITRRPQDGSTAAPGGGYIVKSLKAGDAFGERAILVAQIRTASVKAVKESVLLSMDQWTYFRAIYKKLPNPSDTIPGEALAATAENEEPWEAKFNNLSRSVFLTLGFLRRRAWGKVHILHAAKASVASLHGYATRVEGDIPVSEIIPGFDEGDTQNISFRISPSSRPGIIYLALTKQKIDVIDNIDILHVNIVRIKTRDRELNSFTPPCPSGVLFHRDVRPGLLSPPPSFQQHVLACSARFYRIGLRSRVSSKPRHPQICASVNGAAVLPSEIDFNNWMSQLWA